MQMNSKTNDIVSLIINTFEQLTFSVCLTEKTSLSLVVLITLSFMTDARWRQWWRWLHPAVNCCWTLLLMMKMTDGLSMPSIGDESSRSSCSNGRRFAVAMSLCRHDVIDDVTRTWHRSHVTWSIAEKLKNFQITDMRSIFARFMRLVTDITKTSTRWPSLTKPQWSQLKSVFHSNNRTGNGNHRCKKCSEKNFKKR